MITNPTNFLLVRTVEHALGLAGSLVVRHMGQVPEESILRFEPPGAPQRRTHSSLPDTEFERQPVKNAARIYTVLSGRTKWRITCGRAHY